MSPTDPFTDPLAADPPPDPPPPYPSPGRRSRPARPSRHGRHRLAPQHTQLSSNESDFSQFPASEDETAPLLPPGSPNSHNRRPRTLSTSTALSSTSEGTLSITPSLSHTVFSFFQSDIDYHGQNDDDHADDNTQNRCMSGLQRRRWPLFSSRAWKRYFKPLSQRVYYKALFHLLVLNFPYALAAWVYLFVFTLTGTTLLMALPLGILLSFFDLLGARAFARGELYLQTHFHENLAYPIPYPPRPIFTRLRSSTEDELESGVSVPVYETSFYKNAYSMFTDPTTYTSLFYFLLIKPSITLLLTIFLLIFVPPCFVLVVPAPALLRVVKRVGVWQANVAVEGLCYRVGGAGGV